MKKYLTVLLVISSIHISVSQEIDSAYISNYSNYFVARLYSKMKSNAIKLTSSDDELIYRPNNNVNLGVGFNYRDFGLNLAYGFNFLNNDEQAKGKSKYLDAQSNIYTRKIAANGFFELYRGYYLKDSEKYPELKLDDKPYYIRPDIKTVHIGLSVTYIFNNKRFSAKAPFTHDEWQKKSAGSFLLGAYGSYLNFSADSSIAPRSISSLNSDLNMNLAYFFNLGPQVGYAHSFVYRKHLFLTVYTVVGGGVDLSNSRIERADLSSYWIDHLGLSVKYQFRFAVGYNSDLNFFGLGYLVENFNSNYTDENKFRFAVGSISVHLIHRINYQPKILDKIFDLI